MSELKYSKDHEWLRLDDDNMAVIGISNYAQEQLGDVVYVELPEVGKQVTVDEDMAVVESVKSASDVKAPVSGTVIEVNEQLNDEPEKVNADPTALHIPQERKKLPTSIPCRASGILKGTVASPLRDLFCSATACSWSS